MVQKRKLSDQFALFFVNLFSSGDEIRGRVDVEDILFTGVDITKINPKCAKK